VGQTGKRYLEYNNRTTVSTKMLKATCTLMETRYIIVLKNNNNNNNNNNNTLNQLIIKTIKKSC